MSYDAFVQLCPHATLSPPLATLQSVSGAQLQNLGTIHTHLSIQGSKVEQAFAVVVNLSRPLILGRDFLLAYKGILNYADNTFVFDPSNLWTVETS